MFFKFKDSNFCINCDWLQYSVTLKSAAPELLCPNGYRLELCQGNNIFKERALLFSPDGRKVLTMLWAPYSSVISPLVMTVQVANEWLYQGGIASSISLIKQVVECEFNNMGRIDICCDFEANEYHLKFFKHLNSNHYYVQGKSEGAVWWHRKSNDNFEHKQIHCMAWGSPHSEIKVKLYDKSRELGILDGGESEKPWISKQWELAGLNKMRVWRLEFSLCGAGQLRWNDEVISLEKIESPSWLMRVFFDLYHTRFVTRINQGRKSKEHNRDAHVWLLSLPTDGEHLAWFESKEEKPESKPAIVLLRALMRQFDNEFVMASVHTFNQCANTVIDLVRQANLYDYFEAIFGMGCNQYMAQLKESVGPGIHRHILAPNKCFD